MVMKRGNEGSGDRVIGGAGDRENENDPLSHLSFADFPALPAPGDLLVINDSRVIPARLLARRRGSGDAEVLLVAKQPDGGWRALVRPGARIRAGARLALEGQDAIHVMEHLPTGERIVRLEGPGGDDAILERRGHVPLPPYIERADTAADRERYQTVYARDPGSVAAPTAGLHFTHQVLDTLRGRGVVIAPVTLHVGPGTFRPVTAEDATEHVMDAEWWRIPEETALEIAAARGRGAKVWAVGTTALRTLESAAAEDGTVAAGSGWTTLFIRPGYRFRAVDRLLTNFHLPRSTLLMLVCAFAGTGQALSAYREAVAERYRFYSYGDAMAII
jgi:S-adenosylmethionine:tRNA ribosyltransferase-isomerase